MAEATIAIFILVASLLFLVRFGWSRTPVRPRPGYDAFLRDVYGAIARRDATLLGLSYVGVLRSGRGAQILFSRAELGFKARLYVTMARDAPSLRVRLEDGRAPSSEDLRTGDRAFDERFFLHASDPVAGGRALGAELRRTITQAFSRAGVERLVLRPGELSLELDVGAVSPSDSEWRGLLDTLDHAAGLVETRPVQVRVLEGEREVVVDPEGKTRCTYCRDGITGEEVDLVACDRCRTVMHAACWEEHGSCPMLGCEGKTPERARVG